MKLKKLVSALVACAMILGTMAAVPIFAEESTETNPVEEFMSLKAQSVKETHKIDLNGATVNITEPYYSNIYADITIKNGTINFSDFTTSDGIFRIGYWSCDHPVTLTLENMIINVTDVTARTGVFTMQNQDDTLVLNNSTINATGITDTPGIFYTPNGVGSVRGSVKINGGRMNVVTDSALFFNNDVDLNSTAITCKVDRPVFRQSAGSVEDTTITVNGVIDSAKRGIVEDIAGNPDGTVEFKNSKVVAPEGQTFVKANTTGKVLAIADKASTYTVGETVKPMASEETGVKLIVASINGKSYATLADAVAAALNGGTVTLLSNAEGDGVIVPGGSNVTINLNGFTYNVSGATVGSSGTETSGFQLLGNKVNGVYNGENNTKVTIKNGTLKATSESCGILIQNYSDLTLDNVTLDGREIPNGGGGWPYTLSNNYGTTTITGATNIFARSGGTAFDSCKYGSYSIPTVTVETTGTINGNIELTGGNLIVKSGTFTSNVADYVANGYYQKNNNNGTYTVVPADAKVIDTAKTTGATVTLDNLNKNAVVDPTADATYKVVVSTPAAADADAANKAIASNNDNNTSKAMFDISVVKVDSNGTETVLNNVTDQKVTLTLGETPATGTMVYVYHVKTDGTVEQVAAVPADGTNKVTFTAPSFSTYAVTYTPVAPTEAASKVGVAFSPVSQGSNQYYINLKSLDGKPINRFMSTDLVFKNGCATVDYDITPAANMTASVVSENGASREYRFNMDGKTLSSATGTGITIGTITFYGYGTLDFSVDTLYSSGHAINIVNTAKIANNIVDNYIATGATDDTLIVNEAVNGTDYDNYIADDEYGVIKNVTLAPETKDLTVNIAYNNKINNNAAAYQDMTVTISGGDLTTPIVKHLGSEGYTLTDNVYTVTVANELTQNVAYTVTVEGAGYRTARYTVNMTADKTLNFWNNVMDADTYVEADAGTPSKTNFLAGDIVKDNNINIYDLSAVVSYFGEGSTDVNSDKHLATANPGYAKYDLNRDGVIDSKDVAYVLVSWGK